MTAPNDGEKWLPVLGYEGLYQVSSFGRVLSFPRRTTSGGILSANSRSKGYVAYSLCKLGVQRTIRGHTLVLEAFVGPRPAGLEALHSNGIRTDNRLTNLSWGTTSQNAHDRVKHGTCPLTRENRLKWQ